MRSLPPPGPYRMCDDSTPAGILTRMLLMAVSGAAVLALVCWAMFSEAPPSFVPFLPHRAPDDGEGETVPAAGGDQAGVASALPHGSTGDLSGPPTTGRDQDADEGRGVPREDHH